MGFQIKNGVLRNYTEEPGVTEIVIPDSVTTIYWSAFEGCTSLTSITIPNSVTTIYGGAFEGCTSLTSITIPNSVTSIGVRAFEGFTSLTNITIPNSVTTIDWHAFEGCTSLTSITIPDSVTTIGNYAFRGCTSLTNITIPDSVTTIGWFAFLDCTSLTNITIPDSVTTISYATFKGCTSLTNITIPDSVTTIDLYAFEGCTSLTSITIPNSVTTIYWSAFEGCTSLTSITIPDSVTTIGKGTFEGCTSLTSITIPDSVTTIEDGAFKNCTSLTSITIPDSVTTIGVDAFEGCTSLTSITIPNSVTTICGGAFEGCTSLTNITIPDSVTTIYWNAFSSTPWFEKYPNDFVISGSILIKYKGSDEAVIIPDGVTKIGGGAFEGCTSLTNITIPDSVTTIGGDAFEGCTSLTNITIPDNVTKIGDYAFIGCTSLTNITIPDSVTTIEDGAFKNCTSLTGITIPNSVKSIGWMAFEGCNKLKYIKASFRASIMDRLDGHNPLMIVKKGKKYRFYAISFKNGNSYVDFIKTKLWNDYDLELLNNGPKYKYRLPARLFGGLDRLLNPCELTQENKELYIELLKNNVKKMITIAEEINCPFAVKALFELGIIDESNEKAVKKLIAASSLPEISALAELFDSEPKKPKAKKKKESEAPTDPLTAEYREKLTAIKGNDVIKKMKLIGAKFPKVKLLDGTDAPDELFRFIIASYGADDNYHFNKEADKAAALLSYDSLCEAISAISNGLDLSLYPSVLPVVCRFGNFEQIKAVTKYYSTLKGAKGKALQKKIESALALSDTRVAVLWLEKRDELFGLCKFAGIRNISVEQVYDEYLFDFGFDEQGKRVFDLVTTTIEATISPEITLSLVNTATGKAVRSIPKKNVAPDVYKKAADELADMRATLKKSAKLKKNQLFQAYLNSYKFTAGEWKARYTKNPFLHAIARLLIWSQDGNTFTFADNKTIDSQGSEYRITDNPIKLAHPMEMDKADIDAWQKYFTDNKLKQPFEQIWEVATNPKTITEDRYNGLTIPFFFFKGAAKDGITVSTYTEFNHRWGNLYDINIHFEGCSVDYDCPKNGNGYIENDAKVNIKSFKFKKYTRKINHIVYLLDKWSFVGHILKNDGSFADMLDRFTLAQLLDFIDISTRNDCTNSTAVLLNYRNEHYPEYDAYAALDALLLDDDF